VVGRAVMVTVQLTHNDAVHVSAVARSAYGTMPVGSVPPGMHKFRSYPDWCASVPAGAGDGGGVGGGDGGR
jgi:hypothetical protein